MFIISSFAMSLGESCPMPTADVVTFKTREIADSYFNSLTSDYMKSSSFQVVRVHYVEETENKQKTINSFSFIAPCR